MMTFTLTSDTSVTVICPMSRQSSGLLIVKPKKEDAPSTTSSSASHSVPPLPAAVTGLQQLSTTPQTSARPLQTPTTHKMHFDYLVSKRSPREETIAATPTGKTATTCSLPVAPSNTGSAARYETTGLTDKKAPQLRTREQTLSFSETVNTARIYPFNPEAAPNSKMPSTPETKRCCPS